MTEMQDMKTQEMTTVHLTVSRFFLAVLMRHSISCNKTQICHIKCSLHTYVRNREISVSVQCNQNYVFHEN